jgi:DNA polymerase I-like protein with 3'-5' exonuclease and polymerase domains
MKQATVLMSEQASAYGAKQVAHIHDEIQWEVPDKNAEAWAVFCKDCITKAGEILNFRCRLDGASRVGKTWADTH